MKHFITCSLVLVGILCAGTAGARDNVHRYPIADAMNNASYRQKLGTQVQFYWADQAHPQVLKNFGEAATNKKTNAFGKSDKSACEWVLLSALLQLRDRTLSDGGNAVIGIKSNYKSQEFSSASQYECGAGFVVAGVALKGTVVKVAK